MYPLATAQSIYQLELQAMKAKGISAGTLMQHAVSAMAERLDQELGHYLQSSKNLCLLAGSGNNGADGYLLTIWLNKKYPKLKIQVIYQTPKSDLAKLHWQSLSELPQIELIPLEKFSKLPNCDLYLDAIWGIGFIPIKTSDWSQVINNLNHQSGIKVSIDIPSGLSADLEDNSEQPNVRANYTLMILPLKLGPFLGKKRQSLGKVLVVDIGLTEFLSKANFHLFTNRDLKKTLNLEAHSPAQHKYQKGHALILAGSQKMPGALELCATAAFRLGAGYVTCMSQETTLKPIEAIHVPWKTRLQDLPRKPQVLAMGPGLLISDQVVGQLQQSIIAAQSLKIPLLLDASALLPELVSLLNANDIITPHEGEAHRLLNLPSGTLSRLELFEKLKEKFSCWIVLKGYKTLIGKGQQSYLLSQGNSCLAKAGTGDVLTGFIAALLAQGYPASQAAVLGPAFHGYLADLHVKQYKNHFSLIASDLYNAINSAYLSLQDVK